MQKHSHDLCSQAVLFLAEDQSFEGVEEGLEVGGVSLEHEFLGEAVFAEGSVEEGGSGQLAEVVVVGGNRGVKGSQLVHDQLHEYAGNHSLAVAVGVPQLLSAGEVVPAHNLGHPGEEGEDVGDFFLFQEDAVVVEFSSHELLLFALVEVGKQLNDDLHHHPHDLHVVNQQNLPLADLGEVAGGVDFEHGFEEELEGRLEVGRVVGEVVPELDDSVADEVLAVLNGGYPQVQVGFHAVLVYPLENEPVEAAVGLARHVVELGN